MTCPLYRTKLDPQDVANLKGMPLADYPMEERKFEVDMLIGLDYYWEFVYGSVIKLPNGPRAVKSSFGWLISGVVEGDTRPADCSCLFVGLSSEDHQLQRFWDLESIGICDLSSPNTKEDTVLSKFNDTVQFRKGRYYAWFPWKEDTKCLGDNRALAHKRFTGFLKRLNDSPKLMADYDAVINDQLKRGFIEPVLEEQETTGIVHYIPHHPVVREDRATTKVRVVYDASARPDCHSPSLNDSMYKGPDGLGDLFGMLLRFRENTVALVADIEKDFLQVGLREEDRDATRFFWIDKSNGAQALKEIVYRFARVPFGIIASPFLLNATLQYHLQQHSSNSAAALMQGSFYVDNVVVSVKDSDIAANFYREGKAVLKEAGMNLREWASSSTDVIETIPNEDKVKDKELKVLGLVWNTESDILHVRKLPSQHVATVSPNKRNVLQYISLVFDPLGLVSPVVILGKIFMQKLCLQKLDWDTQLTSDLSEEWASIHSSIEKTSDIRVPRCQHMSHGSNFQIHAFADASQRAYATVLYIRFSSTEGIRTSLLCSKTRVAPLKPCTLPRLELLAVLIATRLTKLVLTHLSVKIEKVYVWSDSQIALAWVGSTKVLKDFVANRVAEIRKSGSEFRYVPTKENPADLPSRGTDSECLSKSEIWWSGPNWLRKAEMTWPVVDSGRYDKQLFESEIKRAERRQSVGAIALLTTADEEFRSNVERYSSLTKLLRVTGWIFRFVSNCRNSQRTDGCLTTTEINKAKLLWELKVQDEAFAQELRCLSTPSRV